MEHFAEAGLITDINLKYKKNGTFRGFAFIGFESNEMAKRALTLHNTYLKQNKISVEMCKNLGNVNFFFYSESYQLYSIFTFTLYI